MSAKNSCNLKTKKSKMPIDEPLNIGSGDEPRQTYCRRCECEMNEIIVGDNRRLVNKTTQQIALVPKDRVEELAEKLGWDILNCSIEMVPPGKLPASEYCDSCKAEIAEFESVIEAGGVYWRCLECNKGGVVAKSKFADDVRLMTGIETPEETGVEFSSCTEHLDLGMSI